MINVTKSDLPPIKVYHKYLEHIWDTKWLTNNGEYAQQLESKLKEFFNLENLSLLSNGTLALQLAIRALDLRGEIITTPFTFAATTTAIIWEQCKPVFADIDPYTFNIDPLEIERKITKKTSAILAVHVYGNPCDVNTLQKIAKKYNLKLIYDAAHAFGVEYNKKSVLKYGDMSTLSFHATKVFNTIEGGAVVSNRQKNIDAVNLLRNFGIVSEEKSVLAGINAKMNEFQAAMGLCNLEYVNKNIEKRKKLYELYIDGLKSNNNVAFQKIIASKYNYSYMPVYFKSKKNRDAVFAALLKNNIKARKYFYPLVSSYSYSNQTTQTSELKIAKQISDGILCLPLYASLENEVVKKIIGIINSLLV